MKQWWGAPSHAIAAPSTGTRVDEDRRLCDPHAYSSTLGTRRDSNRRLMTSHCLALVLSSQEIRMKNLVLGALLAAAASSAACGGMTTEPPPPDTSAVITASWSFNTYANRANAPTAPCPTDTATGMPFDTATVYVRPWDPFVGDFTGPAIASDLFNCSDKVGTTDPLDGIFQVWVQIENHSGSKVYARSEAKVIDTADGDQSITLPTLFTDAGYFDLSWDLLRAGSSTRLRCADAGISTSGRISTSAQMTSGGTIYLDKFPCDDGYGITEELPVGTYDVTVTVTSMPGTDIGASDPITDQPITAPNGLTSLGHVKIIFH